MNNRYNLLSDKNIRSAIPLTSIGVDELSWREKGAIDLICFLSRYNYPILGGDVYQIKESRIVQTLDSWYIIHSPESTDCYQQTVDFIKTYERRNSGVFLYSIIFKES